MIKRESDHNEFVIINFLQEMDKLYLDNDIINSLHGLISKGEKRINQIKKRY